MEAGVQVFTGGVLSGATPVRGKGSRIGQRKFGCDTLVTEASANSAESAGAGLTLGVAPQLESALSTSLPHLCVNQSTDEALPSTQAIAQAGTQWKASSILHLGE